MRARRTSDNETTVRVEGGVGRVVLGPRWTVAEPEVLNANPDLESRILSTVDAGLPIELDGSNVAAMDTAGALVLAQLGERLEKHGRTVRVSGFAPERSLLLELVQGHRVDAPASPKPAAPFDRLAAVTHNLFRNAVGFLSFLGHVFVTSVGALLRPHRIRVPLVLRNLQTAGAEALPIIGLLSLLVGVVIAYQGAIQLHRYGADIFIVDLVGLSLLRELAPLMTAIIVAGRTGAAYTAQIGTMQVTEEVDALRVMGLSPVDVLVRPKVFALLIALPLLTVYADIVSVFGAILMTAATTSIGPSFFLEQFPRVVPVESFLVGVGKAPVFALIIASVGCWQGFQASGAAESVGERTTLSVVQSVFLIIVLDAAFSVVFSLVGI